MEYFLGALIAILVYVFTFKLVKKELNKSNLLQITYSQSHIYELMRPFLELASVVEPSGPRQSSNYLKNVYMKVMVTNNKAYWIKNNTFYVAEVVDGQVQKETTKEVDTMSMSRVELNEMLFIVEKLREESDDNWGAGESKF